MEKLFIKTDANFLTLRGFPARARELYGRLVLYAGKKGQCWVTRATLAKELGVGSDRTITRHLRLLREIGLIDWRLKGPHANRFTVFPPPAREVLEKRLTILKGGQKCPVKGHIKGGQKCLIKGGQKCPPEKMFREKMFPPTPQPPPPEGGRGATPRPVETAASDDGEQQQQAALREDAFAVAAFLDVDLQTAAAFLGRCRAADPGCTLADIQAEITQIAKSLSANRRNPTGIYLTQVPARLATKAETAKRKGEKQAAAPNGHDFAAEAEELRRQWVGMDESERNWWRRERPELIPDEWKTG